MGDIKDTVETPALILEDLSGDTKDTDEMINASTIEDALNLVGEICLSIDILKNNLNMSSSEIGVNLEVLKNQAAKSIKVMDVGIKKQITAVGVRERIRSQLNGDQVVLANNREDRAKLALEEPIMHALYNFTSIFNTNMYILSKRWDLSSPDKRSILIAQIDSSLIALNDFISILHIDYISEEQTNFSNSLTRIAESFNTNQSDSTDNINVNFNLEMLNSVKFMDTDIYFILYVIEMITNARKVGATKVDFQILDIKDTNLVLTADDNGPGFPEDWLTGDEEEILSNAKENHGKSVKEGFHTSGRGLSLFGNVKKI
ncbi:MAG: ATP-binding protein [Candidatus Dojkabacteria bacterium]|nr:ATP-binding protein [Candidatus Dojkabacteria bacterium]MDQ7020583.1 ATP-binding protein [Candidatus Dojkabacteria bacterium]